MAMAALPAAALNTSERFFLGVERSVTGRAWRDRLDERGQARALTIAQRHGIPELLARVLAGRGVEPDEVEAYLDPTIKRLMPDPNTLTAMEAAATRIADAITRARASPFSATTTWTAPPRRRCSQVSFANAGSIRSSTSPTAYSKATGRMWMPFARLRKRA